LCRTGKTAAGEKLFVQVARDPAYQTPEVALVNAGVCVGAAGDVLDAERYFNRALAVRPNMPEALLQLGNLAYDRGDFAQALSLVQRYLGVNSPTPEILWLGFRAERKLGDNTAAADYARRVESEFPNSDQAQLMRAGVER
jgi:type IV pilus assembly protein PilF